MTLKLKPENYADVQNVMETKLDLGKNDNIRNCILLAALKITESRINTYIPSGFWNGKNESYKSSFINMLAARVSADVLNSCDLDFENHEQILYKKSLLSSNWKIERTLFYDVKDTFTSAQKSISNLMLRSIENNIEISDNRIAAETAERINNYGEQLRESSEGSGGNAYDTSDRGRNGLSERGRTETLGGNAGTGVETPVISDDAAGGETESVIGMEINGSEAERTGSLRENAAEFLSGKISGNAAEPDGERLTGSSHGISSDERGTGDESDDNQYGDDRYRLDNSGGTGELHNEESVVHDIPDVSRERNDKNVGLLIKDKRSFYNDNEIIGNTLYRYISDKKYIKGNAEHIRELTERLMSENHKVSAVIKGDTATLTVSGTLTKATAKKYLDEIMSGNEYAPVEEKNNYFIDEHNRNKLDNPNSVILYPVGDFFEAYLEDAEIMAKALNLTLTERGTGNGEIIPMVGIPSHSMGTYMQQLMAETGMGISIKQLPKENPQAEKAVEDTPAITESNDTYTVYQLKVNHFPNRKLRFESLNSIGSRDLVNKENYNQIYSSALNGMSLEDIYTKFNIDKPQDFKGHSLSVSDIVVINKDGEEKAYYVDSIGFTEMPEFFKESKPTLQSGIPYPDYSVLDKDFPDVYGSLPISKEFAVTLPKEMYLSKVVDNDLLMISAEDIGSHNGLLAITESLWEQHYIINCESFKTLAEVLSKDTELASKYTSANSSDRIFFRDKVLEHIAEMNDDVFVNHIMKQYNTDKDEFDYLIGKLYALTGEKLSNIKAVNQKKEIRISDIVRESPNIFIGGIPPLPKEKEITDVETSESENRDNWLPFAVNDIIEFEGRQFKITDINYDAEEVRMLDLELKGLYPITRAVSFNDASMVEYLRTVKENESQFDLLGNPIPASDNESSANTAFDEQVIKTELMLGSGFQDGKFRIEELASKNPSTEDFAKFLSKEYGTGGHSGDDIVKWSDHDSKGIRITLRDERKINVSWKSVAKRIAELVKNGEYITQSDIDRRIRHARYAIDNYDSSNTFDLKQIKESEKILEGYGLLDKAADVPENDIEDNSPPGNSTALPIDDNDLPFNAEDESPMGINYRITDDNFNEGGGAKARYVQNITAIKLLKTIEAEQRNASPDEQQILSGYVGWGGIPQVFDKYNEKWSNEYSELKELLTPDEYKAASKSTMNAHYTSATVINAIYKGIENLGFDSGKILEPACGSGNFFGMLPESMEKSKLYGVELDGITGRIAKQLYPNAAISVNGFENTNFPDNSFDVAVGNVPFGAYHITDKRYDNENFYIHDYFIAKSLDKVKPGGIVAFITSKGTMDKNDSAARRYFAERAELLGAVRLPNNAFKANAGTEVTTDIIFLQKRENPVDISYDAPEWVNLGLTDSGLSVNQYFAYNPQMVLGKIVPGNKLYGNQSDDTMCIPIEGANLKEQLADAISNIKGNISKEKAVSINDINSGSVPADLSIPVGNYGVVGGKLFYRNDLASMELVNKPKSTIERAVAMVELRNSVYNLLEMQIENINNRYENDIAYLRKELNDKYDHFTAKYGRIADKANSKAFAGDNTYHLIKSLEVYDSNNNFTGKADIFTVNTVKPKILLDKVDNAADALILSVAEKAKVDFEYMTELTGMDKETLISELGNKIYQLPNSDKWVTEDEYLTGNIRQKLAEAEAAEGMERNVEALKLALPLRVEAADIDPKLGAAWIDPDYVRQFAVKTFEMSRNVEKSFKVDYSRFGDKWKVDGWKSNYYNSAVNEIYGIPEYNAYEILEATLNFKRVEVKKPKRDDNGKIIYDQYDKPVMVVDIEKTTVAEQKQKDIKRRFAEWAFEDPERREALVNTFNERFNSIRLRQYDGSNLNFVGMNPLINFKEHQRNAVARMLYSGNTLLPYKVGAGKTFMMIAAAMEGKRLGLHNKPMMAVPNHLTEQFAADFRKLYPAANILVATEKDMKKENRRDFMAKIAVNSYDAIIIGHSSFDRLRLSPEMEAKYINEELESLRYALEEAKAENGSRSFSVKQIELSIEKLETKLEKTMAKLGDDKVIPFDKLGIDKLFIDESHYYKNLDIPTKMTRVAGLGSGGSGKSLSLLMKCRYLDEKTNHNACVFASGTPVSNSMTELYTIMRYLQPEKMEAAGINSFDGWASVFAECVHSMELKPECDGKFQMKTRIQNYTCFEQLMTMFGECADIHAAAQIELPIPEHTVENIVAPAAPAVKREMLNLSKRAKDIRRGYYENGVKVDPRDDNFLKLTIDGKKIGLDLRLANPDAADNPNSKVNLCVNKVTEIYRETTDSRGVQMIFCDLSTPKKDNPNSYAVYKKDSEGEYNLVYTGKLDSNASFESLTRKFTNSRSLPKDYNKDEYGILNSDDVIVIRRTDNEGNVTNEACYSDIDGASGNVTDEFFNNVGLERYIDHNAPPKFCVYDDIKAKLINNGIPENEVVFIHDYDKAEDKQRLFQKMNEGEVRVLLGSTFKCGAGMNAQRKMAALHHLDAPARPSDMEQREGRILRQGNENKHVRIFRYMTDRTFDSYSYQILENKQKFISQLMSGKIKVKTCEDIDEKTLEYAEVKALIAGNPLIKVKIDLETEINTLRILKSSFDRQKYNIQDKALKQIPQNISLAENVKSNIERDIATVGSQVPKNDSDGKECFPVNIDGTEYLNREEAGKALKDSMLDADILKGKEKEVGSYKGFALLVHFDTFSSTFKAHLKGQYNYYCALNSDSKIKASGNITRIDNLINSIPSHLESKVQEIETLNKDLEIAKNAASAEFPQMKELTDKEAELLKVDIQLREAEKKSSPESLHIYEQLTEMFPTIMSGDESFIELSAGEAFDKLIVERLSDDVILMAHTYVQNGDVMSDPVIRFRVDDLEGTATTVEFVNHGMGIAREYEDGSPEQADCDSFVVTWFANIAEQGYERVMDEELLDVEIPVCTGTYDR